MRFLIAVFLTLAFPAAVAAPYKCKAASGSITYQDRPCEADKTAVEYKAKPLEQMPQDASTNEFGWVGSGKRHSSKSQCQGHDKVLYDYGDPRCEADYEKKLAAQKQLETERGEKVMKCLTLRANPESMIGMSFADFRSVCTDTHSDRNTSTTVRGTSTQWVYRDYRMYIYTDGDVIRSVQSY